MKALTLRCMPCFVGASHVLGQSFWGCKPGLAGTNPVLVGEKGLGEKEGGTNGVFRYMAVYHVREGFFWGGKSCFWGTHTTFGEHSGDSFGSAKPGFGGRKLSFWSVITIPFLDANLEFKVRRRNPDSSFGCANLILGG